jgi:hypothetical protein
MATTSYTQAYLTISTNAMVLYILEVNGIVGAKDVLILKAASRTISCISLKPFLVGKTSYGFKHFTKVLTRTLKHPSQHSSIIELLVYALEGSFKANNL